MPDWLDSTIIVAIIGAAGLIIQHTLNRQGRKEEIGATENDNLLQRQGDQIKTLIDEHRWMKNRLDWLEGELWNERKHGHKLHRGLGSAVDWGEDMVRWADGDQLRPYPRPPDWLLLRDLLDTPRPRRPPPPDDT